MIIVVVFDLSGVIDVVIGVLQLGDIYIVFGVKSVDVLMNVLMDVVFVDGLIVVVVLLVDVDLGVVFDFELLDWIIREVLQKIVVFVFGDDLQVVLLVIDIKEVLFIVNMNEMVVGGDMQVVFVEMVQQIVEVMFFVLGGSGVGGGVDWLFFVVIGGVVFFVVVGMVIGVFVWWCCMFVSVIVLDFVFVDICFWVDCFCELQVDYVRVLGDVVVVQIVVGIDVFVFYVEQLFLCLDVKVDVDQIVFVEVEYFDKFVWFVVVFELDYLFDLFICFDLWDVLDECIGEVCEVLDGLMMQIVDNIKQVNVCKGLFFQVLLDLLIGCFELCDWECQFNQGLKE